MSVNINKVAVLGSGVMGSGIAAHLAGAGLDVVLLDMLPKELTEKEISKGLTMNDSRVRNRVAQSNKDRVTNPRNKAIYSKNMASRIKVGNFQDDMNLISDCDWIIEVIVENLEIKKEFIKKIGEYAKDDCIVSSNTSGVSINKIVEDLPLEFRQKFLGTHFFNPPRYMKLFEVIAGQDTLPEVVDFMYEFGTKRLGKGIILAKDTPGFIANRIGSHALVTAVKLTEKYGYDFGTVDQLTGPVIGRPKSATFRTLDMVGLDVFKKVPSNTIKAIDDVDEIEALTIPNFVEKLISDGRLGDKSKEGFYKKVRSESGTKTYMWDYKKQVYTEAIRVKNPILEEAKKSENPLSTLVYGDSKESKFVWENIKSTLLYCAKIMPTITDNFKDIDRGMMWGYNWELGPFAIWDMIGLEKSVEKMKDEGEVIPSWIQDRLAFGNKKFYDGVDTDESYISLKESKNNIVSENNGARLLDIGDGILCLEFKSKGNTITEDVVEMIMTSVREVEKNFKGLVIGNINKNFSVGANISVVSKLASQGEYKVIEGMIDNLQKANMALKYCKKPVISAPYGMTLGGGAELVMHTHMTTAHAETYMGLVESGVGLIPAGGGIKELLFRMMDKLGNVSTGEVLGELRETWRNIVLAKVSSSAHDAVEKGFINKNDQIVMNRDYIIDEAKKTALFLSNSGFRPLEKKKIQVLGATGRAALQFDLDFLSRGGFISDYDAFIANKVAYVLTGGNVSNGVYVTEEQILQLEKEAFIDLCKEEKTIERMKGMLKTGKRLRN